MSVADSDGSVFYCDSKVKKYLRQTLEDKCSTIGGRQVYFGLNDSMIRMLTPIEEIMTPVSGQSTRSVTPSSAHLFSGNTTSWTLINPEDFSEKLTEQDLTDVNIHQVRCLREHVVGQHKGNDLKMAINKGVHAPTKSDSTIKPTKCIGQSELSSGQKSNRADTLTKSNRNKELCRLSGGQGDRLNEKLNKKIKSGKKKKRPPVCVQSPSENGHKVTNTELPAIQKSVVKRVSNEQKQNPSSDKRRHSGARVNFTNGSAKCTLPPLEKDSSTVPKKSMKTKPRKERDGISNLPSVQQVCNFDKRQSGENSKTLPPIESVSGRSTSAHREATREVKLTRSFQFHDTQAVGVTKRKRERVDKVRDNVSLPRINLSKRPL